MSDASVPAADTDSRPRLRRVLLCILLLLPLTVPAGADRVSANYAFVLLLFAPRRYRVNYEALTYLVFCVVSLLIGMLLFSGFDGRFILRQLVSFGLTVIGVLLLFVRLRIQLEEFLVAVVGAAVLYSMLVIATVVLYGFTLQDVYTIKYGLQGLVPDWPQRYVVVVLVGFFIALARWWRGLRWQATTLLLLSCILLTFTRAAWLALAVGALAYLATRIFARPVHARLAPRRTRRRRRLLGMVVLLAVGTFALSNDAVYNAGQQMVGDLILALTTDVADMDVNQSEGARLALWSGILGVLKWSPLTGTGFAGIYLFIPEIGSAHSQYFDILLRTGIVGLLLYLWFWKRLLVEYARPYPEITAACVSLLVFGAFHETTKLSYGGLMFFILLNKAYERARARRHAPAALAPVVPATVPAT